MLLIGLIIVYPLFVSVDLSFQNVNIARLDQPRRPFTTANYERCSPRRISGIACWVTFKLVVIVTVFCVAARPRHGAAGQQPVQGPQLARLLVALPWAVPEVDRGRHLRLDLRFLVRPDELDLHQARPRRHDDQLVLLAGRRLRGRLRRDGLEGLSVRLDHDAGRAAVDPGGFLQRRQGRGAKAWQRLRLHHHAVR